MAAASGEAGKAAAELAASVADAHTAVPSTLQTNMTITQALPLAGRSRAVLQRYFKRDLSMVRVHTGKLARKMNETMNSHAFTVGNDIYLHSEDALRDDASGIALLGHEVSHVLQQGQQPVRRDFIQRSTIQRETPSAAINGTGEAESEAQQPVLSEVEQIEKLADQVYAMMYEELRLERERRGT